MRPVGWHAGIGALPALQLSEESGCGDQLFSQRAAHKHHGSRPFMFRLKGIGVTLGAPDLLASQELEKEKQSGTKLETALVALNQASSSQPVITQLLWVAFQARIWVTLKLLPEHLSPWQAMEGNVTGSLRTDISAPSFID